MGFKEYEIVYSKKFHADLFEMLDCLNGFSKTTAERYYELVNRKIDTLRMAPFGATYVRDERLRALGYRWIYIRNYCLFFIVHEEEQIVQIERIQYSRREMDLIL